MSLIILVDKVLCAFRYSNFNGKQKRKVSQIKNPVLKENVFPKK
jgi:hypothetical protein